MNEMAQMQQPTDNVPTMFPQDSGAAPVGGSHVGTQRSMDPRNSLEDYNRTMLEYTQRQMTSFVDLDDTNSSGISSRSSRSSGSSGASGNGVLARQANGPPPTSAGAAAAAQHRAQHDRKPAQSPNEAKPSRY